MVVESIIFGLLSALALGVSDLTSAAIARKFGIIRTALGLHIVAVAVSTVYLISAPDLGGVTLAQWAALAGLSTLVLSFYFGFYRSLQLSPVAIVSPIISAHAVVIVLLAVTITGERLSGGQIAGIVAIVGGVVLASINLNELRAGKGLVGKGIILAILVTLGIGLWQYSIGVLSRDMGWFLPIYINRVFGLAMLLPISMARRELPWQKLSKTLVVGVVVIGIFETGGLFAFARGAEVGIISIVAAASTIYPILPIAGGLVLFRERLGVNQGVGLGLALAGLLVLGLSS